MKLLTWTIALILIPAVALAATTASVNVSADVSEQLELVVTLKRVVDSQDPGTEGTDVTSMGFGSLTDTFADGTNAGSLFSRTWFAAFLVAKTSGRPYVIRQSSDGLTSGSNTIPTNAYLMIPDYEPNDLFTWPGGSAAQGAQPTGSTLGSAGPATGLNKTVYTSGSAGLSRIIRCYYTVTNGYKADGSTWDGFSGDPISLDQPSGNYSGTVTYSVVLQ